jgi:branched-chain amino acid transport system substrate-binding protein
MLRKIAGVGMLIAAIGAGGLAGCKKPAGEAAQSSTVIPIGQYASLTGGTASFGINADKGLTLAFDTVNAAGGVLGKQIKLETLDDASDLTQAVTVVQSLIDHGNVAIVGEIASKRSLAGGGICEKNHIPMLSPGSTNPAVTVKDGQVRQYVFRVCFTDTLQGQVDGQFGLEQGWKHVGVLVNSEEDYSEGLADAFEKAYAAGGGEVVDEETYTGSTVDFEAQLQRMKQKNPDAVYVPGYYNDVKLILQQAKQLGIDVPFWGGDGWDGGDLVDLPEAQGMYYSDHFSAEDPRPEVQAFVKAYEAKNGGQVPDAMAVLGYDAGMVLADAIKRAGSADPAAITAALAQTKDFPGISGKITIDADHNAKKTIDMLKIQNHKPTLFKAYPPS